VGHLLGGPELLALATASRRPGVALLIAAENFPDQKPVAPALVLYVIVGAIASVPYTRWRRRSSRGRLPRPEADAANVQ